MTSVNAAPLDERAWPVISPHCRVVTRPPNEILVIADDTEVRLTGELFCALAQHLDGSSTIAEISERMVAEGSATAEEVPQAIAILRNRGYLVDARLADDPAFLYRLSSGIAAAESADRGLPGGVELIGLGEVPLQLLGEALAGHGYAVTTGTGIDGEAILDASLSVLVADDLLHPDLASVCAQRRALGRPVLLVCPNGPRPTIGPWLTAVGPCYACLASRLRFNRQVEDQALDPGERMGPVARGWTPASAAHTGAEIAFMIEEFVRAQRATEPPDDRALPDESTASESPRARLLLIDHATGERSWHAVVRLPQCPSCGSPRSVDDPEHVITLMSTALDAESGRSYRRIPPTAVMQVYGHHVSPRTGIVERLQPAAIDGGLVHVIESGVNLAIVRKGGSSTGFRQSASGKGITADQAVAGALAEAIERYSNSWHGDEPTIVNSLDELTRQGMRGIDPRSLQLFSARQYAQRNAAGRPKGGPFIVPEEFDPSVRMEFSPAWSITHDERCWVPTAESFYGYRGIHPRNGCIAQSNGCAAGTTIEDAILQGFFELVERDAVAMWWYNRARRPGVDLDAYADGFHEPYIRRIREHYRTELDRDLWVLDVTSDLGIPCFVACSTAQRGRPRTLLGFGAHRDPLGALLRAITEMNQMLAMIPAMERPGTGDDDAGDPARAWWALESLDADQHVLPDGTPTVPGVHEHDWGMDGRENVERSVALVAARGMDMHVLNATRPDIGLPVVKVMVPGMRHFWPRFGPGRLYDVPVDLGWIARPTAEEDLNPRPMFW